LAAGDAIWDAKLMSDVLRHPPWDAVCFDVSFVGGPTAAGDLMRVAADAGLNVELVSYGHTVIQAANLHVALAYGRTTYFGRRRPWNHSSTGFVLRSEQVRMGWCSHPRDPGSASSSTTRRSTASRSRW